MIKENKTNLYKILTYRVKVKEMKEIYKIFNEREGNMQKICVQIKFSGPPALKTFKS